MKRIAAYSILGLLTSGVMLAQSPDIILTRLMGNSRLIEARDFIAANHDRLVQQGAELEDQGPASRYKKLLESSHLKDVMVDERGNVSAVRTGQQDGPFVAVLSQLDSTQSVTSMAVIAHAMESAGITTKAGLLFVGVNKADGASDGIRAARDFFENGPYHGRIRSCLLIQSSAENTVFGPPNAIGSTIVQYGIQSVGAYAGEPIYATAKGILEVPIELRIPAVGMGIGDGASTARGIQIVMTALLAIAGV